jgi:hypothetical protein
MVEVLSQQQTIHCAKVGRKVSLEGKLVGEQTTN